jgi:hypothetical protein
MVWRRCFAVLCYVAVLFALATPTYAIKCDVFLIPNEYHSGSGYTAIEYGPDGKVYVGTAWYGGSAHLIRFDPQTEKWENLFDAHSITREKMTALDAQGKFHAKLLVDGDGLIWAATKHGNEEFVQRPEYGEDAGGYPGGHLFSYNPKTNEVVDHGILVKQNGIIGGAIDVQRRRLYYASDSLSHFLIYDIASNTLRDLGYIGPIPRYMPRDSKGRVFMHGGTPRDPFGGVPAGAKRPYLTMYDPATDRLYSLAIEVDGPEADAYTAPYVLVANATGDHLFACSMFGKYVMDFDLNSISLNRSDPLANGSIRVRHISMGVPEGKQGGDQHAGVLGKDGCFYFNSDDQLMRYDPKEQKVENLGTIELPPDIKIGSSQGACVAPDGTLYMKFLYPYKLLRFSGLTAPRGQQ